MYNFNKHKRESGPDANTTEITQERKPYLTFEALLVKNRVWVSVYQGGRGFWDKFSRKKCVAQFAYGFEVFGATAHLGRK